MKQSMKLAHSLFPLLAALPGCGADAGSFDDASYDSTTEALEQAYVDDAADDDSSRDVGNGTGDSTRSAGEGTGGREPNASTAQGSQGVSMFCEHTSSAFVICDVFTVPEVELQSYSWSHTPPLHIDSNLGLTTSYTCGLGSSGGSVSFSYVTTSGQTNTITRPTNCNPTGGGNPCAFPAPFCYIVR